MKASEFENIIRKIVREEISSALKQTAQQKTTTNPDNRITENKSLVAHKKASVPKIKTGNSQLDKVLSETSIDGFSSSEPQSIRESLTSGIEVIGKNIPIPKTDINNMPVNVESLPEALINGLTRDYSSLLKKANNIANRSRPV